MRFGTSAREPGRGLRPEGVPCWDWGDDGVQILCYWPDRDEDGELGALQCWMECGGEDLW